MLLSVLLFFRVTMSESLRGSKSSGSRNNSYSSGSGNSNHGRNHDSIPNKFSSIVNKVESLINKMNYDKHNHNNRHDVEKALKSPKENRRKPKSKHEYKHNNKYERNMNGSQRTTSIDSLNNLTDLDSFEDRDTNDTTTTTTTTTTNTSITMATTSTNNTNEMYSDSDDAEIAHITGTTSVQVHRRIELDQLTDETIREFNEQCSSLSHDLEFYNSWQNEEELEQHSANRQTTNGDIYEDSVQNQFKTNQPNSLIKQPVTTKDANNNVCTPSEIDTQDWLDRQEMDEQYHRDKQEQLKMEATNKPLTHIQQIVNNITQQQYNTSPKQNLNEIIEIDKVNEDENGSGGVGGSNSFNNCFTIQQTIATNNGNMTKTRRSSVASSGSVGRMETILEEPTECKISVKEILQRFETMNKNEVHSIDFDYV